MTPRAFAAVLWMGAPLLLSSLPSCKDDATVVPATPDAGSKVPCLDRPADLQRPPTAGGALPCDLLPPDFGKK